MGASAGGIGMVLQGLSGGLSAYGTFQQGQTNQRLAEKQADILDIQARLALEKGNFAAEQTRLEGQKVQGTQAASFAAQGVNVATGSAAALQDETAMLSEEDAKRQKLNAAREAWGMTEQAKVTRWKGDLTHQQSKLDMIGGLLGTGGKMLS